LSEAALLTPDAFQRSPAWTRRRVQALDAFLDLVLEGNLPPTTEQLAERAGISQATLFRYFETLDVLRRDAAVRMLERFPLLRVADVGLGPLRDRIERFAAIRLALWEKVHLLARLQRSAVLRDPGAAQMVELVRRVMADEVREHFAPELRALTAARRDDAVALIASLTSVESWEQFRHTFGRSPLQTRRAWGDAIQAILSQEPRP
jgi:AcrR family transcriptional regulator